METWLLFALWLGILLLTSYLCRRVVSRLFGRHFEIAVFPGTIAHEVSHAVGCLITGARITRFAIFERDGGYVAHTEPKIPVIGQVLISLAPIIGCGILMVLCLGLAGIGDVDPDLPARLTLSAEGMGEFVGATLSAISGAVKGVGGADWASPLTYLWLYLAVSMAAMLGPSRGDLRNASLGMGVTILIIWGLGALLRAFDLPNSALTGLPRLIWQPLSDLVCLSMVVAGVALTLGALRVGVQSLRWQAAKQPRNE